MLSWRNKKNVNIFFQLKFALSGALYKRIAQNLLARTSESAYFVSYPLYRGLDRTAQIHDSIRADILHIH